MTSIDIPTRQEILNIVKEEFRKRLNEYDKFNKMRDEKLILLEETTRILRHQVEMLLAK